MIKGNKGEWSEVYVLLRLLADGRIYAADEDLNKLKEIYFPIIKIIREETKGKINEYYTGEEIKILMNGKEISKLPVNEFENQADELLNSITKGKNKGSFEILDTETFMKKIECYKISAPSSKKADITMEIIDTNTGYSPTVGFSIKSELGNPPTLLNAGKTTNFTYKIIHDKYLEVLRETNSIYITRGKKQHIDVKGRIVNIINNNSYIEYHDMDNENFKDNLILIDSFMDRIIAETLLYFYRDGIINCKEMIKKLEEENPLGYGNINAYSYKFKKFLTSVALGMKPSTKWDGTDEANGGYIIVTREGNVLAYHIYNRNYFEEYLLNNTKYETASTSRHGFGEVYTESNNEFIKLNLQIRFIK